MTNKIALVTTECIVREPDGDGWKLTFLGCDIRKRIAVARCNNRIATEDDYALIADLPVFDHDVEPVLEVL